MNYQGWILDLYHKPDRMIIWLKQSNGDTVRLVDNWNPKIHVGGDYHDLVELACAHSSESSHFVEYYEKASDLEKSRVLEINVESEKDAERLAKKIQREGKYSKYRLYNVDVPSPQVYLYQKNLFPLAKVEATEAHGHIEWNLLDSRDTIDFELPPLSKIRLQVQTWKNKRVHTFKDEISSIQIIPEHTDPIVIDSGSESDKIHNFVRNLQNIDPDIVLTAGGDSFLFPYLARRAFENNILDKLVLGREVSPLRIYEVQGHSYFSYGKILYRDTAARLLGRLHIDDQNAFLVIDGGLEGLYEIARTCVIPLQRASRATIGTNMSSLQLYHAMKRNILIPWNKNQPEEWKNGNELVVADRGGFIYEPKMGIHDQVGELDFASLYPMLMLKNNLSGETVKCKCCPNSPNRVPELDYHICNRPGIVPLSLEILLRRRAEYKKLKQSSLDKITKQKYDERQSALKWILVCCLPYDSPVLISQNGIVSYQKIGKVIDERLGSDAVGIFDCPDDLLVAGVDKNLKSKFCKVSKLIKTVSPEKIFQIRMENGRQVNCTPNHSFYVLRNGNLVEATADKLSKGDLIPTAKRAQESLRRISKNIRFQKLQQTHAQVQTLLDSDIAFVAVKEISEIYSPSLYVYCFEISSENGNLPGFFTGSGSILVHNSFGYLGFKNARFGKIDAHIATCAFSRVVIKQAIAIAEENGFRLVHGIVDSMWLRKPGATVGDYEKLSNRISSKLNLPLGFEGQYKWIVFLNSKTDPDIPVLNRYYGIFEDGTIKIRGIDLRRHDTPNIVRKCQSSMLEIFSQAENSEQFISLIPKALGVLRGYAMMVRAGKISLEDLVITKNLSKEPAEYTHHVPQAEAAKYLVKEGGLVHAGQQVDYILVRENSQKNSGRKAIPWEIADDNTCYDIEEYVKLLASSAANLLLPFGYNTERLLSRL